jgi:hypothetical protein
LSSFGLLRSPGVFLAISYRVGIKASSERAGAIPIGQAAPGPSGAETKRRRDPDRARLANCSRVYIGSSNAAVIFKEGIPAMGRMTGLVVALALALAPLTACKTGNPESENNYFPLTPNSTWTYQIFAKSQGTQYQITDRVVGVKYVPALKLTGSIVDESYSLERGGTRPLVYYAKDGYIARLSALDYDQKTILAPSWGRSEESQFLPLQLQPNLAWSNVIFPYGHLSGSFDINQSHRTFAESKQIETPAGRFDKCIRIETQARYEGGMYARKKPQLELTYLDWYAPNVGLIKTVALEGGPGGPEMDRVVLIRFNVTPNVALGGAH